MGGDPPPTEGFGQFGIGILFGDEIGHLFGGAGHEGGALVAFGQISDDDDAVGLTGDGAGDIGLQRVAGDKAMLRRDPIGAHDQRVIGKLLRQRLGGAAKAAALGAHHLASGQEHPAAVVASQRGDGRDRIGHHRETRMPPQLFGHIGGGGADVEEDGHLVLDQLGGLAGDGGFCTGVFLQRAGVDRRVLRVGQVGATMHPLHLARLRQTAHQTTDCLLRDPQGMGDLGIAGGTAKAGKHLKDFVSTMRDLVRLIHGARPLRDSTCPTKVHEDVTVLCIILPRVTVFDRNLRNCDGELRRTCCLLI